MSTEAQPKRLVLASTVLEFELSDGRSLRVPAPRRGQVARVADLEAREICPPEPALAHSAPGTPPGGENDFAKGPRRFAKGMQSADDPALLALRAEQLAILTENAEPPLNVETLSAAELLQMLWALVGHHYEHDANVASRACQAVLATGHTALI